MQAQQQTLIDAQLTEWGGRFFWAAANNPNYLQTGNGSVV